MEELKGKRCWSAWGLKKPCRDCPVVKAFETGSPCRAELSPETQDHWPRGKGSWLTMANPIRDAQGRTIAAIETSMDITERNQAEETLAKSDALFRTLAAIAPVGITFTDPNGNCRYANPRWCEHAGLEPEEALGLGWGKGMHPEDRASVFSDWYRMAESDGRWEKDYRFRTPGGKVTWVHGMAAPVRDPSGKTVGYVGVNVDITERKEADALAKG